MDTNTQVNLQMKRLDSKGIKKAMEFAKKDIGGCSSVILLGDRTTALPDFVDPKNARDLTSGNRMATLFDFVAGILDVKKQALVYQEIRGKLIAGDFKDTDTPKVSVPTAPAPVAVHKMSEKELPANVLDFVAPFKAPITTPRPR